MIIKKITYALILSILPVVLAPGLLLAAKPVLLKESAVWLEGDSTLHRFSSTSTALVADFTADLPDRIDPRTPVLSALGEKALRRFTLRIPVATLKSGKSQLDKNLMKAMKAAEHPDIVFEMATYQIIPLANGGVDEGAEIELRGQLNIAGVPREIILKGRAKGGPDRAAVNGSYDLLMTDYGVQPPVMMMGTLKTKNEITVRYALYLAIEN